MKTKKLDAKQLVALIENISQEIKQENQKKARVRKKLEEKLELNRMGARHGGVLMTFGQWEAGAPADNEEVVYHMQQTHGNEKKSEIQWAKLYNSYEDAMQHADYSPEMSQK